MRKEKWMGAVCGVALLTMLFLPLRASAAVTGSCGEHATYQFDKGTLTISGSGSIEARDAMKALNPTKIVIKDGITEIKSETFQDYKAVKEVSLPKGLVGMDYKAFAGTKALQEITIPASVTQTTFTGCVFEGSGLQKITFAKGTKKILGNFCYGCENLKTVVFPDSVEVIGSGAFCKCGKLETVTLPKSLTTLGVETFSGTAIKEITIPTKVTGILGTGDSPFKDVDGRKSSLKKITFAEGATVIAGCICRGASALESVTLPLSATEIRNSAFADCPALKYINIYDKVNKIWDSAFDGTKKVTILGYSGTTAEQYAKANKLTFKALGQVPAKIGESAVAGNLKYKVLNPAIDGTGTVTVVSLEKNVDTATIPATVKIKGYQYQVTEISAKAFYNKSKLKKIVIQSKTITRMGKNAFKGIKKGAVIKVPANKKKEYKAMIRKAGAASNVKIQ